MLATLARSTRGYACQQRGLTLIELLIIMAVLAVLTTIAMLWYGDVSDQAKIAKAIADIATIQGDIDTFEATNDRLPNDLSEVGRASLKDPWGNPYQYTNFSNTPQGQWRKDHNLVPLNSTYDLFSMGKDGQSQPPLTASASRDDIVRANDGNYVGLASRY
ncbi:MAG TPA: type II secretion system protein GspG [Methylomirabilota bacterium]|nr:type II secretion system protein GspG [Methylomirabilota bacterium]